MNLIPDLVCIQQIEPNKSTLRTRGKTVNLHCLQSRLYSGLFPSGKFSEESFICCLLFSSKIEYMVKNDFLRRYCNRLAFTITFKPNFRILLIYSVLPLSKTLFTFCSELFLIILHFLLRYDSFQEKVSS